MIVLGIETATDVCGVAVVCDGKVAGEESIAGRHIHSERLLSLIETVLRHVPSYDVVAVSTGPGSFTGLRIGLSVAKGLAFGSDRPLVAVPTLEALVYRTVMQKCSPSFGFVLALIDARRNDAYAALYGVDGDERRNIWGPRAVSLEQIFELLPTDGAITIVGDGAEKFRKFLEFNGRSIGASFPDQEDWICSAAAVALLGEKLARCGNYSALASVEPLYVKEFETLVATQHISSTDREK
jgi:tRNA threonylcarbamoyladenosine biosynthesis protein TsaB